MCCNGQHTHYVQSSFLIKFKHKEYVRDNAHFFWSTELADTTSTKTVWQMCLQLSHIFRRQVIRQISSNFQNLQTAPKTRLFTLCWHTIPLHLATAHVSDSTVVHIITYTLGMLKPFIFQNRFFTGYRKAYCERDNCHRSLRACYQSIACCFTAVWPAFQTHGRPPTPRNEGQWRIKAVGGRGNRCFCRRELITIVMPLSQPGSAKTAASVCLYSVHREQERSLFTAALE